MAWLLSAMTEFIAFVRAVVMQNFYEDKMFTKHPEFCRGGRKRDFQFAPCKVHKGFPKLELPDPTLSTAHHRSIQRGQDTAQKFGGLFGPLSKQT